MVSTPVRYLSARSIRARWLASKAVVLPARGRMLVKVSMNDDGGFGAAGASESGEGAGSGWAAGGGEVPVFGCGAGLGTGTVCATAATAIRLATMVHATAARLAVRIAPSAPLRRVPARYGNLTT